jgi:hypothetical protein
MMAIAQIRRSFPELTRCVHCGVLDQHTKQTVYVATYERDVPLLTVWLHETGCSEAWQPPQPLAREHEPPERGSFQRQPSYKFRARMVKRPPPRPRCFTCEKYELPEHKFNRLGYEPIDGWRRYR